MTNKNGALEKKNEGKKRGASSLSNSGRYQHQGERRWGLGSIGGTAWEVLLIALWLPQPPCLLQSMVEACRKLEGVKILERPFPPLVRLHGHSVWP